MSKQNISIRYHSALPQWAKVVGLEIRSVPKCEGGGFMIRKDQAEKIVELFNGTDLSLKVISDRLDCSADALSICEAITKLRKPVGKVSKKKDKKLCSDTDADVMCDECNCWKQTRANCS